MREFWGRCKVGIISVVVVLSCIYGFFKAAEKQLFYAEWAVKEYAVFYDKYDEHENIVFCYGGRYGLADKETHAVILKPFAKWLGDFNDEGIAIYNDIETSLYGLVNNEGKIILQPVMDEYVFPKKSYNHEIDTTIAYYDDTKEKWGVVDCFGEIKIEPVLSFVQEYLNEQTIIYSDNLEQKESKKKLMTIEGEKIDLAEFYEIEKIGQNYAYKDAETSLYGVVDQQFQVISQPNIKEFTSTRSTNGVIVYKDKNDMYGCLDEDGVIIKEGFATELFLLSNGVYKFEDKETQQTGLINATMDIVIEPKYENLETTSDKNIMLFTDSVSGKKGLIKLDGKIIVDSFMENMEDFDELGLARYTTEKDGLFGLINKEGKIIIDSVVYELGEFDEQGFAKYTTEKEGLYGLINREGKVIQEPFVSEIDEFNELGVARYYITPSQTYFGFVNDSWEILTQPIIASFEEVTPYGWYIYTTSTDGEYGIMDKDFRIVQEPFAYMIYASSSVKLDEPAIKFKGKNGKYGLLNLEGEIIKEEFADEIYFDEQTESIFTFEINDKHGLIDAKGAVLLEAIADYRIDFKDKETAIYSVDRKKGLIDQTGKIVQEPFAYDIKPFDKNGEARYYKNEESYSGTINTQGEIIDESK